MRGPFVRRMIDDKGLIFDVVEMSIISAIMWGRSERMGRMKRDDGVDDLVEVFPRERGG
jgi:hypothetical protein